MQYNEQPSNWEYTDLDELSTIETSFVIHGLGHALLNGLPPKKSYMDCLKKAGFGFLGIEQPVGSGIFPHHERSPYDTLNANAHASESLALIFHCLDKIYGKRINIFLQGARRGFSHTLDLQWENGCFPYRANSGTTLNYTSLVLWCFLNALDILPDNCLIDWPEPDRIRRQFARAADFLSSNVQPDGTLDWEGNESTTAKYNIWAYALTANVLSRIDGYSDAACRILRYLSSIQTKSGLLLMKDRGEEVTECLYMQADAMLFLQGGALGEWR